MPARTGVVWYNFGGWNVGEGGSGRQKHVALNNDLKYGGIKFMYENSLKY